MNKNDIPLVSLWAKRSLILYLSILDIKLRFKGAHLGFIWSAIEPLFIFLILYVVFSSIRESVIDDFAIYLIIGVLFFQLFARGTMNGLLSLQSNQSILKSINIRKEIFPTIATTTTLLFLLVQLGVFFLLMIPFQFVPHWTVVFLPIVLVLFLILVQGLSYILSIVYIHIKDIQPVWGIAVYSLIFISPVFWYVDEVDGILLKIQKINPLGQIIELGHKVVFGEIPSLSEWLYTLSFVLGIFFFGFILFSKYGKKIVEIL